MGEISELNAGAPTTYKIRIYGQAFVYERQNKPTVTIEKSPYGIDIPVKNWYKEYECKQLAVNHNSIYIKENEIDHLLTELCKEIKRSLSEKGLIV